MPMHYRLNFIKKRCIIVDIDDTIGRSTLNVIPPNMDPDSLGKDIRELWNKYHEDVKYYDLEYIKPLHNVINLIEGYIHYCCISHVIFLTGREDNENGLIRLNTARFISKYFEGYSSPAKCNEHLLMRPKDDYRPNHLVKEELLTKYILPEYDVVMVFDDNEENTQMFLKYGINVVKPYVV